jgi:hypothetical protein
LLRERRAFWTPSPNPVLPNSAKYVAPNITSKHQSENVKTHDNKQAAFSTHVAEIEPIKSVQISGAILWCVFLGEERQIRFIHAPLELKTDSKPNGIENVFDCSETESF